MTQFHWHPLPSDLFQQQLTLTDAVLTELAQHVAATDMEVIALEHMGIKAPTIKNLNEVNKEKRENFNFEILRFWRDKSADNSIEVSLKPKDISSTIISIVEMCNQEEL